MTKNASQTYVALLRGINVGGNAKVEMKKLKKTFESLNFTNVSTYINSGNVLFSTTTEMKESEIIHQIETQVEKDFGFTVRTIIRSAESIKKLSKLLPKEWANDDEQRVDILFLWDEYNSRKSIDLIPHKPEYETLTYYPEAGAIAWRILRINVNKSGLKKFIGSAVYKHMTARNINTVRKLSELLK